MPILQQKCSNKLYEEMRKRFNDINRFILLLRKNVYPYGSMDKV